MSRWSLSAISAQLMRAGAVALAPIALFVALRVRPMAASTMIDPAFYTAYAENGRDLMERFGTVNYFWVRVGFILPASLFQHLFGALGGFYAFRYTLSLLAVVPAYQLFVRLHGRAAGWVAILVILASPVILTAWGSDYPDSAALSYLVAGTACLLMPAARERRRRWVLLAGALLTLAVHSQLVALLVAGSVVLAYLVVSWRGRRVAESCEDLLLLAAAAVVMTALLVGMSVAYYGRWDIASPTLQAIIRYRQPDEIALFHSSTWRFLVYDIYLVAPPAAAASWLAVIARARAAVPREEWVLVLALGLSLAAYAAAQFVGQNWTLEYYLYSSLLFAVGSLVVAALLVRLAGPLIGSGAWTLAPAALVVAVPVLFRPFRPGLQLELPAAVALGVAAVAIALAVRSRPAASRGARLAAVALTLAALTSVVVAPRIDRPPFPGQAAYYTPDYGSVLFTDGDRTVDDYAVASRIHQVVPAVAREPGGMLLWWAKVHRPVVDQAAAQYLWQSDEVSESLPVLADPQASYLVRKRPRFLVLLSDDGHEFDAAMRELSQRGFGARTWRDSRLTDGSSRLCVRVVELISFPAESGG